MITVSKEVPAKSGDVQLAAQTYQQSMQDLSAMVSAKPSESGVVILQPGQLSVVQVQAGKQYKLRKSGAPNQTPDDLIAVRHGDALHVRYADGSVVHFEDFYTTCTDSSVCSVNLASDSAAGATLSADMLNAGPVADDGLLVYAHGDTEVLMSMAQDQTGLGAALQNADAGDTLTYFAPSPYLGMGALALMSAGVMAGATSTAPTDNTSGDATIAAQNNALRKISAAADANNASGTTAVAALTRDDYKTAGVTGIADGDAALVAAVNSALDTAPIAASQVNTATKLQAIFDAYKAILASADGTAGNTSTALTGEQYAAIGVTGVPTGSPTAGSALKLLDEMVDKSAAADVDTVAELQAKADAALHLIAAAGGSAAEAAKLTVADLLALGVTNANAGNIEAIRAAIQATKPDTAIDELGEVKAVVDAVVAGASNALIKISNAAGANNASGSGSVAALTVEDYAKAGVTGVTADNVGAINTALDSVPVTADKADTIAEVQSIFDAYKAILASADGTAGNTSTALTGEQYAAIGVTGVPTGSPTAGSALKLLDEMVDKSAAADVDTVAELQAKADAALHLIAAAGGSAAEAAKLTVADLLALGATNANAGNIEAIRAAIQATKPDIAIDELGEVKAVVDAAVTGASNALIKISNAAGANNASGSGSIAALTVEDYAKAGVTGVTAGNVGAINTALDSVPVTADKADTTAEVQAIVDAYKAILASADGKAGNTASALTGEQYAAIGVTGLPKGSPTEGGILKLLDETVDKSEASAVSTVSQLQAMADAAAHVIAAAGGTTTDAEKLTVDDLKALGFTGVTVDNIIAVRTAILNTTPDTAIDQQVELTEIITNAIAGISNALEKISKAAGSNNASGDTGVAALNLDDYSKANVTGLTAGNVASVNSALDTAAVTAEQANTTAEVQAIVDAYTAILNSADGTGRNTNPALTGAQYNTIGVTGVSGVATEGTPVYLLNEVVDSKIMDAVDTASEVQALATAAAHVISAASGGTELSAKELGLLGVSGVTDTNIAAVRAAIAATLDNGIEVDTVQELQSLADKVITVSDVSLHTNLGGTTNLDVTSNLVFTVDRTVVKGTSGLIHITDLGGGTGFHGDTTNNTQTIDLGTALGQGMVKIIGTGANTTIVINPEWDLDLSSNYQISFDAGVFVDAQGHGSTALQPIAFSTVKPGGHGTGTALSEAVASQTMSDTGALVASKLWLDVEGIGNITAPMAQLGDLSTGAYALAMKNYATQPGGASGNRSDGIVTHSTNFGVQNFGNNDIVYFDSQVNNSSIQLFDAKFSELTDGSLKSGGLAGQNTLVLGTSSDQIAGASFVGLGLEGNTTNKIYPAVYNLDANTPGWADAWHNAATPLIMG